MSKTVKGFQTIRDEFDLPRSISADARDAILHHLDEIDDSSIDRDRTSHIVTTDLCDLINSMHEEGVSVADMLTVLPISSRDTLYRHINGDCTHNYGNRVTYSQCGWMRVHASNGAPTKTLAMLNEISDRCAAKHITGGCNHEDGIEPLDSNELYNNGRNGGGMKTSICEECGDEFEHKSYRERRFCSKSCSAANAGRKGAQVTNEKRYG